MFLFHDLHLNQVPPGKLTWLAGKSNSFKSGFPSLFMVVFSATGQIIATSGEVTPNGLGIIVIYTDASSAGVLSS